MVACGDMLKLSFQDSNKYAGLVISAALSTLLNDRSIQLNATLTAPHNKRDQISEKTRINSTYLPQDSSVRIIVYGLASEKVAVGNILSDAGLFLQHPLSNEYDRHVTYINPHYLLRPGSQMPELEQLSTNADSGAPNSPDALDEANKNRFMNIFDHANETDVSLIIKPNYRLRTTLEKYVLIIHL